MVIINIPYDPLKYKSKMKFPLFKTLIRSLFNIVYWGAYHSLLLSRYITRSIEEVRKKIEGVQINEANEKLIWKKKMKLVYL